MMHGLSTFDLLSTGEAACPAIASMGTWGSKWQLKALFFALLIKYFIYGLTKFCDFP